MIAAHLDNPVVPDPDLLIRTSGEMRISNFYLWQIAYSELYVTPTFGRIFARESFFKPSLNISVGAGALAARRANRRFGHGDGDGGWKAILAPGSRRQRWIPLLIGLVGWAPSWMFTAFF